MLDTPRQIRDLVTDLAIRSCVTILGGGRGRIGNVGCVAGGKAPLCLPRWFNSYEVQGLLTLVRTFDGGFLGAFLGEFLSWMYW